MSALLAAVAAPRVFVADGLVHIADLTMADPDLLAMVTSAPNPEAIVRKALSTGARVLSVAQATIDTTMVEASFAALTHALETQIDEASSKVTGAASKVLNDPSSGVAASLLTWRREMDVLLDATFNPERSTSAFGKLDQILQNASDRQFTATRRLLNPDAEDSPFARVLTGVREQVSGVLDAVARLSEQVAAGKATSVAVAATLERSAVKGQAYEDQVAVAVTGFAAERGDVAVATGRVSGSTGGLVGDIVVDVDPTSTGGTCGRYVLECKDRRLTVRAVLAELQKAAVNRDAHAAIAVFSRVENAPVPDPFTVFDNQAIIVYDKDEPDPAVLRLACAWGRWIVQRDARPDHDQVDAELVHKLVEDARQVLGRRTSIRRAHSAATKKIQEAVGLVDDLHDDLSEIIDRIDRAILVP